MVAAAAAAHAMCGGGTPGELEIPAPGQTKQPRLPAPGIKLHKLLAVKTSGGWGSRINCWSLRRVHLKGLHGPRTYANPPTLGTTTRATARGGPVTRGKWVKSLDMGSVKQAASFPLQPLPHI